MKKAMLVLAMVAGISMAFVSCGKKGKCAECGKENVSVTTVTADVGGETITGDLCKDCKKAFDADMKAAKAAGVAD